MIGFSARNLSKELCDSDGGIRTVAEHHPFYYPHACFVNAQLQLLKVAALYFYKLYVLGLVAASRATIGADHRARNAVMHLQNVGIVQLLTPADVLVNSSRERKLDHAS